MKWTEDVNCKTQCGTMASRCSDQTITRCDRTLTAFSDNSNVCGDDDERDVYRSNDKSHVLISTGVSKRKKKTDAFES